MEKDTSVLDWKTVASVLGGLLIILLGVVDRIWTASTQDQLQQLRDADQRTDSQAVAMESRLKRQLDDHEQRIRDIERLCRK